MNIGLRIDVDTLRGTREGVPALLRILQKRGVRATWFFSVGPDNMGRHIRRLLRPAFALKMLRSRAAGLYGWDILLCGAFWPGPRIAGRCAQAIREVAEAGHELGYHAWDHHAWQAGIEAWSEADVGDEMQRGLAALSEAAGAAPTCTAAPGWRCTQAALQAKDKLGFRFHSDCRGTSLFQPLENGAPLNHVQAPVTLPTYDELVGRNGVTPENYNDAMIALLKQDSLNILTIHAEVEGGVCSAMFEAFLDKTLAQGRAYTPLGHIVEKTDSAPQGRMIRGSVPGREGWVAVQAPR